LKSAKIQLRGPVYRYNAETCRYERAGISWPRTIFYALGLLATSSVLLIGFLSGYDALVETEKEKALQNENTVLVKSGATLKSQIAQLENTLNNISTRDQSLHNKFFASTINSVAEETDDTPANVLLGNYEETQQYISKLEERSVDLLSDARATNSSITGFRPHNALATSLPADRPIAGMTANDIVSGFGMRINPFHKALYSHEGVDIMAMRGTHVLSTGPGEVITVKHNSVEAGYGNYVEIDHKNGFVTRYAHLENILVRKGDLLTRAAIIGTSGSTGGAIAPHLHYEVICHGKNVDPVKYMVYGLDAREFEKFIQMASRENQSLD
jgi:murein DD-endopeptidase MepM/ murein hydrolase activator NlpD